MRNVAEDTKKPAEKIGRAQEPERTPPAENSAAWVEKYATWASQVLIEKRTTQK